MFFQNTFFAHPLGAAFFSLPRHLSLCVHTSPSVPKIHLFNAVFMAANVFLGGTPFKWEHIGIAYIYGFLCESRHYAGRVY